jgi:hypothetical protein
MCICQPIVFGGGTRIIIILIPPEGGIISGETVLLSCPDEAAAELWHDVWEEDRAEQRAVRVF